MEGVTGPSARTLTIGCLGSGTGRTVLGLDKLCRNGRIPGRVAVVIATRPTAPLLQRADAAGIPTRLIAPGADLDDHIDEALATFGVDLVCLCGYLRRFRVGCWAGRCLNVHPALLPKHGGRGLWGHHVHEAVLDAGDSESGCTIHEVDDQYDHGPILVQRRCPVLPDDTADRLAARVFEEECRAWPEAIDRWLALRGAATVG